MITRGPVPSECWRLTMLLMDEMDPRLSGTNLAKSRQSDGTVSDRFRPANLQLVESGERFRDLFEEAPIPYVYEGIDSRIIHANRAAAMRILGVRPEEVAGLLGSSLVPN